MRHVLLQTPGFVRDARNVLKANARARARFEAALKQLESDPFHASLKTHKLKGELKAFWACSAGYDLRILLQFTRQGNLPAVLLLAVGSHDEVY